ncbi:MAG: hypothetical protein HC780_05175 [Leptolyngbyaceae cyanobacterium CSU_1_3]|nr:hypothetical protein [Leptolyngbyaceae cyanobacterium CSU_1_3]
MKVGYLHIGEPEHGIARYGRYLANEARTRPELTVIEATVLLTGEATVDHQTSRLLQSVFLRQILSIFSTTHRSGEAKSSFKTSTLF